MPFRLPACIIIISVLATQQVPGLEPFRGSLEEIYDKFNKYKRTVPVRCGLRRLLLARPDACPSSAPPPPPSLPRHLVGHAGRDAGRSRCRPPGLAAPHPGAPPLPPDCAAAAACPPLAHLA